MTGFRTYPGEHIIFSEGGVASFELGSNPTYGEGILTNRRFVHKLSPIFNPQAYFVFPNGIDLSLPINEVKCFGFEDDLLFIEVDHGEAIMLKVRTSVDWLTAWQKALGELHGSAPHEDENGRWEVTRKPGGDQ